MVATSGRKQDRWRSARRRVFRRLADRATRRRILVVLATLVAVGVLAAIKSLIGFYLFSSKSTRIEVALTFVAVVAAVFALCQRKVASYIESRLNRNTREHREALAALRDEIAEIPDPRELERRLVERFDALFATRGTVLYVGDGETYEAVAHSAGGDVAPLTPAEPLVGALRKSHLPVAPAETGSEIDAPLAWPLRARGHLIGILVAGEHDYLESFDAIEIEAVQALADGAAANLAFLDTSLTAHLVHTPNNLPPLSNAFIGRARELAECREILAAGRLLTLTGFGGAGKSRLARELAQGALASHRSGVFWVDLADAHDEAHVVSAIAAALGVTDLDHGAEAVAKRLGNGDSLLVLDTCEHVKAVVARVAAGLLHACPRVALLLTSQSPLGIGGERDFAVPPLAVPDEDADPAGCDAVALFVERARAVVRDFAPDASSLRDVAAIVRTLDGIPLAIELAAARLKVMSVASVRAHLDESLKLLGGSGTADARHHTMRASLAWSYDPLIDADQRLLRRLSVFAGGFTLDAAARVGADAGDPLDVLDPVGRLAEASLLLVTRHGDDEPRYRLPETLRQFLAELLARDGDAAAVRARHAVYYLDAATREMAALHRRDAAAAMLRLDHDAANFTAAHRFALTMPDAACALELAHALVPYWRDRGLVVRARERVGEALAHPAALQAPRARFEALLDAATLDLDCERPQDAKAHADDALAVARSLGEDALRCRALALRAHACAATGAPWESDIGEAVALARASADRGLLRATLDDAGEVLAHANRLDDAASAVDESLAIARDSDDAPALHTALRDAAQVAAACADLTRARALLREAVDLALASHAQVDGEHDLEAASALASASLDWAHAARYAGAADAGHETFTQVPTRARNGSGAIRDALGPVEFEVAYEAGRRMPLEDALAEARAWLSTTPRRPGEAG